MPVEFPLAGKRVWVAGHRGMVGSALMRRLASENCGLLTATRAELDLRRQADTERWIADQKPNVVFLAAARVGGILANRDHPGEFLYDNLMISANVIEAARQNNVERVILLGSSCVYPREAPQPIREESLLTGPLEPTNEPYAVAKIAGLKLAGSYRRQYGCRFISAQPTNVYGPGDNYDLQSSHVLAALIRKVHEAKTSGRSEVIVWGTGTPRREFIHADDLADALVFLAKHYDGETSINIGTGEEVSVRELAEMICSVAGFEGRIRLDPSYPDGTPRKILDTTRLADLGWQPRITLSSGIRREYASYAEPHANRPGSAAPI